MRRGELPALTWGDLDLERAELTVSRNYRVMGGKEYRTALKHAFKLTDSQLLFPFAGLPLGYALQATKRAITNNSPLL